MKKVSVAFLITTLLIISWACSKSNNSPSVSFTASALDSVKVSTLDSSTIVNIIQNHTANYFVPVLPNTPSSVYNRTLYFTCTGASSDFRVIYTGDTTATTSHVYLDNPKNDSTILNLGYSLTNSFFANQYSKAGTYTVSVVATNVKNTGNDLFRSVLSQTYIIK